MLANPATMWLAAISAAITAGIFLWKKYIKQEEEVALKQTKLEESAKRISDSYVQQRGKVEALTEAIHNNNFSLGYRKKAIEELKRIIPDYHASLDKEGTLYDENTEAIKKYLDTLEDRIKVEMMQADLVKATQDKVSYQRDIDNAQDQITLLVGKTRELTALRLKLEDEMENAPQRQKSAIQAKIWALDAEIFTNEELIKIEKERKLAASKNLKQTIELQDTYKKKLEELYGVEPPKELTAEEIKAQAEAEKEKIAQLEKIKQLRKDLDALYETDISTMSKKELEAHKLKIDLINEQLAKAKLRGADENKLISKKQDLENKIAMEEELKDASLSDQRYLYHLKRLEELKEELADWENFYTKLSEAEKKRIAELEAMKASRDKMDMYLRLKIDSDDLADQAQKALKNRTVILPVTLSFSLSQGSDAMEEDPSIAADEDFYKGLEERKEYIQQWVDNIKNMMTDAASYIFETIGAALVGGDKDKGMQEYLTKLGQFLKQIGSLFVAFGIAQTKFYLSLAEGPLGIPGLIAAGATLVVLGSAITQASKNKAKGMADGGIVYGNTLVNVGEYPGAKSNPEVIAPLDKLKSLIGNQESAQNYKFVIDGYTLVAMAEKVQRKNKIT